MLSDKTKAVVKAFGFALLTSVVLTGIGSLLNYLHYNKTGNLLFYRSITGGEYKGQEGFGWISNHTFTMEVYGEVVGKNRVWLNFSASSLIKTVLLIFACCFIVLLIVFLLINKLKDNKVIISMNGENFISANGTEIIEKQFSKIDVAITDEESIVVSDSSFSDCVVNIKDIQNLEITNCTFNNSTFVVSLNDPAVFVENCCFNECEFISICITGVSNQSELVDNKLNNCKLKEACINSDISVLGGNICNCEVTSFNGKLNMLMDLHVEDCKGIYVDLDCAVLKCKFKRSSVDELKHVGKIG